MRWLRRLIRQLRSTRDQIRSIEIALKQLEVARQKLTEDPASIGLVRPQLADVARFITRKALLESDSDRTLAVLTDSNAQMDRISGAIDQLRISLLTALELAKRDKSKTKNDSKDKDSNSEAADRSQSSERSEASKPSEPSEAPRPPEPSEPSALSKPSEPSKLSEPPERSKPFERSDPSELSQLSKRSEPSKTFEPSEPPERSEPSQPFKTGGGASLPKAALSSQSGVLSGVTDKLYQASQSKLLGIAMLCAAGGAVGGTIVLGGQTFRPHENIDNAEGDLKASRKQVEDLTNKNIAELTAMRKDAESKIGDLKNEADKMKEDAVKRVVERLNIELAAKLDEVRSDNATFIKSQLALLAPAREKIAEDIDQTKKTLPLLGDAAKLEQTIIAINAARDQANSARDLAAQSAKEAKEAAQNEIVKMQGFSAPLNERNPKLEKSIPDLTLLNDRVAKLETSISDLATPKAPDLTPLSERMAKLERSVSDLAAPKLPDLTPLNERMAKLERSVADLAAPKLPDLTPLNERMAKLERSVSDLAAPKLPDLTPLNERMAKLEKSASDVAAPKLPDLTPLNERMAKLERSASDLTPPKAPDLTPLNDRVTKVEKLVSDLPTDSRLAKLERSVSDVYRLLNEQLEDLRKLSPDLAPLNDRIVSLEKSVGYLLLPFEPDLTFDQWRKIQIALTDRGFSPGPVDGLSGPHTRNAIRQFQGKSGADATGHLTRPQIAELWGLQSPQARPR